MAPLPPKLLSGLLLVFLFVAKTCFSQGLSFQHFTSENGLSENFIYSLLQDKKGFLWIGTHDGLNRYDGYRFQKFRHDPADTNSIIDNSIYSICQDANGILWIGTNSGLSRYDPETGLFSSINLQRKLKAVAQVLPVGKNELMIWHEGRLCLLDTRTKTEIPLVIANDAAIMRVYSKFPIAQDRNGDLYMMQHFQDKTNILQYNRKQRAFNHYTTLQAPGQFVGRGILFIDSRDNCWVAENDSIVYVFDLSKNKIKESNVQQPVFNVRSSAVRDIAEDFQGNIWIASNTGLLFYDRKIGRVQEYRKDSKSINSLSSDDVQQIYQDRTGIVWVGTSNGLNKLNLFQKKFNHLTASPDHKKGLYDNFILGVFTEKGDVLRIHYNKYDDRHFTRYHIPSKRFNHIPQSQYNPRQWLKEVSVKNPERLNDELIDKILDAYFDPAAVTGDQPGQIWIDMNQQFWGAPNWMNDTTIIYSHLNGNELWIASSKGLILFNTANHSRTLFDCDPSRKNSISSEDVTCFIYENDGNMWIGTKGGGLNYFDRKKNSFSHFTERDGLCNSSIYCMVKDDNGKLWLGTSFGLSNFDPKTKKFQNYFRSDGLVNTEYNRYSACKTADGTIFMGGMNGIDYFHPDSLINSAVTPPQVEITGFRIFNQPGYLQQNQELKYDQNFINIEFAAIDFTNPEANQFIYKLEGADKNWIQSEGRNNVNYSFLKPGQYRFLVKGRNSHGIWNEKPAVFYFTISKPWYTRWWFAVSIVGIVSVTIYGLFRYRLQQRLHVLQVRNRLHRDLHDDIGATLSSVKAYSEILKDNPDNPMIADLIKDNSIETLERLDVIAWATNPQNDNFKSLVSRISKFALPLCHSRKIECVIENRGISDDLLMAGEVRQNIFLVVKEAITNMIKYANASRCRIFFQTREKFLVLQITDDGDGSDGSIYGNGSGWHNMRKRTEELKGRLEINSAPGRGTEIILSLPHPRKIPSSWD